MAERMTDALELEEKKYGVQEASLKDGVQELSDLPSEHALTLVEHDWRLVRFRSLAQLRPKVVPDILLAMNKPTHLAVPAEWAQRLPGDARGEVEAFDNTAVGPVLHMLRSGLYTDEGIGYDSLFGICDAADAERSSYAPDYFSSGSRARERYTHSFNEEAVRKILLPEEFAALDGLFMALAEASQEMFDIRQPA